jgi:hypothetical protein
MKKVFMKSSQLQQTLQNEGVIYFYFYFCFPIIIYDDRHHINLHGGVLDAQNLSTSLCCPTRRRLVEFNASDFWPRAAGS